MQAEKRRRISNRAIQTAALIVIVCANLMAARTASAQARDFGYMRIVTQSGQMAGESTDRAYYGWIPLRQANMPTAAEIVAISEAAASGAANPADQRSVNRPVVIYKDRDRSSLALLGAKTSHQVFRQVDIVIMKSGDVLAKQYKLTDATVISVRDAGTAGGMEADEEQVRLTYSKIEIVQ